MANDKIQTQGAALTPKERELGITDFQKKSRSYGILAKGETLTADDAADLAMLCAYDVLVGNVDLAKGAVIFKAIDNKLTREDQIIRREEMALKGELKRVKGIKTAAKRRSLY